MVRIEIPCEACGNHPSMEDAIEGIDSGARYICPYCITLPSDVLARMIRERKHEENKQLDQAEHGANIDERQFQLRFIEERGEKSE